MLERNMKIYTGFNELMYPFMKYLKNVYYIRFWYVQEGRDFDKQFEFLDKYKSSLKIPETDEIKQLCELWDEEYLYDLILNSFSDCIFENLEYDKEYLLTLRHD